MSIDANKLIIAMNKVDMYDDGHDWDKKNNKPTEKLRKHLNKAVEEMQNKIKISTGITVKPIYYSAGRKDRKQKPWNLIALYEEMHNKAPSEKKMALGISITKEKENLNGGDDFDKKKGKIQGELTGILIEELQQPPETPTPKPNDGGWLKIIVSGLASALFGIFSL